MTGALVTLLLQASQGCGREGTARVIIIHALQMQCQANITLCVILACVTLYSTVLNSVWGQQMEALYKVLMCEKVKSVFDAGLKFTVRLESLNEGRFLPPDAMLARY